MDEVKNGTLSLTSRTSKREKTIKPERTELQDYTVASLNSSHTCDINIDRGECCQRNCSHILCSHPQQKPLGCFIIQWLSYQDWSRTIVSVWSQVETNWHVGLWDKPLLQVVSDTGISKGRSCFDCLHSSKSACNQPFCKHSNVSKSFCAFILPDIQLQNTKLL